MFSSATNVIARNDYYAFGKRHASGILPAGNDASNRWLYNGKERQVTGSLGFLDYGARMYDPEIVRWFNTDPLAEKYYSWSQYVYAANNPVRYIDPNGMEIAEASLKLWEKEKGTIQKRVDRLERRMGKGKGGNNLGERVSSLNGTLSTMGTMEASSQVYALAPGAGEMGGLIYDKGTGVIILNYEGTSNFVHEVTHGGQFESEDMAFNTSINGGTLGQDVYDEVAAYGAQYAYDPYSVSGLTSSSSVNSSADITTSWVQGITTSKGERPYAPGGTARTGIYPVNVNSTRADLLKSYPETSIPRVPNTTPLKNIYPTYYKQ